MKSVHNIYTKIKTKKRAAGENFLGFVLNLNFLIPKFGFPQGKCQLHFPSQQAAHAWSPSECESQWGANKIEFMAKSFLAFGT